jgi:hypothetical protein
LYTIYWHLFQRWSFHGQYAQADLWLARLENAAPDPNGAGLYETLQAHNAYYRGDLAAAVAWARAALAQLREQGGNTGLTRLTLESLLLHAVAWQARLHTWQALATLAEAPDLAASGAVHWVAPHAEAACWWEFPLVR